MASAMDKPAPTPAPPAAPQPDPIAASTAATPMGVLLPGAAASTRPPVAPAAAPARPPPIAPRQCVPPAAAGGRPALRRRLLAQARQGMEQRQPAPFPSVCP